MAERTLATVEVDPTLAVGAIRAASLWHDGARGSDFDEILLRVTPAAIETPAGADPRRSVTTARSRPGPTSRWR